MNSRKRQARPVAAGKRTRVAQRRRAVKTAQVAKARQKGEARNAARALGLNAPARKRKVEPVFHKSVAEPDTSIPRASKPGA